MFANLVFLILSGILLASRFTITRGSSFVAVTLVGNATTIL